MSIDFTCALPTANSSLRSFLYKQVATVTTQGNTWSFTACKVNVATLAHKETPSKSDTFKVTQQWTPLVSHWHRVDSTKRDKEDIFTDNLAYDTTSQTKVEIRLLVFTAFGHHSVKSFVFLLDNSSVSCVLGTDFIFYHSCSSPVYQDSVQVQNGPNAALVSVIWMEISSHTQWNLTGMAPLSTDTPLAPWNKFYDWNIFLIISTKAIQ